MKIKIGLVAGMMCAQALGQGAEPESTGLEEILVTAQKRAERAQDVPIAIDTVSGESILEKRIAGPDDLIKQFPNLSLKTASAINSGFSIRGVGTQNFHLTAQQAVGQYFDEVSQVTPFTSQLGLYDMERIEILRGPQNTLFGRNTTGGAVNFITHRPDPDEGTNGYARVNVGNIGRLDLEGALGYAFTDTFAMRIAAQSQGRSGPFRDADTGDRLGSIKRRSARIGFAWEPDEETSILLSAHYGKSDGTRVPRKATGRFLADNVTPCPVNNSGQEQFDGVTPCFARDKTGALFNPSLPEWRQAWDAATNVARVSNGGGLLKIEHDFGPVSVSSLTSLEDVRMHMGDESGGLPYIQFQAQQQGDYSTFSQELRLTSNGEGRVKWIGGLFYSSEEHEFATIARNNAVGPPGLSVVPTVMIDQKGDVKSAYGQVEVEVVENLNINLGLRYTSDDKSGDRIAVAVFDTHNGTNTGTRLPMDFLYSRDFLLGLAPSFTTACAPGVVPCAGPRQQVSQEFSRTAGKIGVDYHFGPDVMVYASYSTGFKSGTFDTRAQAVFNGSGNTPVAPEYLNAMEVGLKSQFLDRRLLVNASLFKYDWEDLQVFATVPGVGPAFLNLPESELLGQELEVQFAPGADFLVRLNAAHLDTEITDVGTLGVDAAVLGAPLHNAPEWTYNLNLSKGFSIGDDKLSVNLGGRYTSEQYGTLTRRPNTFVAETVFVDASVNYDFGAKKRFSLSAWGDNLTAEKTCYVLGDLDGFTWTNACQPNEGEALFGVSLTARF
jgi:iron complex outermembrane recepter protein